MDTLDLLKKIFGAGEDEFACVDIAVSSRELPKGHVKETLGYLGIAATGGCQFAVVETLDQATGKIVWVLAAVSFNPDGSGTSRPIGILVDTSSAEFIARYKPVLEMPGVEKKDMN